VRLITSWFSTILLLLIMLLSLPLQAATQPNEAQLRKELKQAEANKGMANQAEIVQALQGALSWLADAKESDIRTQQYQKAIDNFPKLTRELRQQLAQENGNPLPVPDNMSTSELEQQVLQISSQLLELSRLSQQEQDRAREISDSLSQLPQQQSEARRILAEISTRIQAQSNSSTPLRAKLKSMNWSFPSFQPTTGRNCRGCGQSYTKNVRSGLMLSS
jgi:miniconductance mechanosensitive channel